MMISNIEKSKSVKISDKERYVAELCISTAVI